MKVDNLIPLFIAALGSVGLWQAIVWFMNLRANQRKANAEADRETAGALVAAVGVNKAGFEADSVVVTNSREIMAMAMETLKVYQTELAAAKEEKNKAVEENRKLQAQMQAMSQKFGAMELVIVDIASGVKRLSDQLQGHGLEPIWKPTVSSHQLDHVLSDAVMDDVKKLFQ
jgi:hypothetical protein